MRKPATLPPQPTILPAPLKQLRRQLAEANTPNRREHAAARIIYAYQLHYSAGDIQQNLQQLKQQAFDIHAGLPLVRQEREKLLFFYEFTALVVEATVALTGHK